MFDAMVTGQMMFSEIIGHIMYAFVPPDFKLTLCRTITQPVVAHVPTFGALLPHLRVDKAGSC